MLLAEYQMGRARSPLAAYNALQITLMRRFIAMGGTPEQWCARLAPAFRRRYGWMVGKAKGQAGSTA